MLVLSVCRNNHWELFVCVTNPFHIFKLLRVLYSGHYNSLLCVVLSIVHKCFPNVSLSKLRNSRYFWLQLVLFGGACSMVTAQIVKAARHWNLVQVSRGWARPGQSWAAEQSKKRKGCLRSEDCLLPHCSPPISRCQLRHPGDPARPGAWWPAATV